MVTRDKQSMNPFATLRFFEDFLWTLFAAVILTFPAFVYAQEFEATETPIETSRLVDNELMSGPHYRLEEQAYIKGHMNHYAMQSDFGSFSAESDFGLRTLIREVAAIAELQKMSKTKAFSEAMANTVKVPVEVAANVVTNPVETAKKVPAGANRLFKRTARTVSDTAEALQNMSSQEKSSSEGSSGDTTTKAVEAGKNYAQDQIGLNNAIRKLSKDLKVDPYSPNPVLQKELRSVAWAITAGSFATSQLVSMPSEIGDIGQLSSLVWDADPLDLRLHNEELLAEMGADEALIKAFYANQFFTTTSRTLLVGSLAALTDVSGRTTLVENASKSESGQEAELYTQLARLLVAYGKSRSPVIQLFSSSNSGLPLALTESGSMALFVPVDYLLWTQQVSEAAIRITEEMNQAASHQIREVWVLGQVSSKAQTGLTSAGFKVFDRSDERLQ
ncbi:MAG: hypothetical protein P8Y12_03390 [Gammaproteobacteria bacterium]